MARVPNIRGTDSVPAGPLAWLKDWLESLRTWVRMRDPAEATVGDALDKFTTRGDLVQWGVMTRNAGGQFVGSGGGAGGPITIVVPPGPGGGSAYVPDLTPPPTPTGLTVTAGITNIYIGLNAPTYTVGNGHARTNIYGAIWAPGEAEPTFSDPRTKLIDNIVGPGTFHAYASNPATRWAIWIKFQTRDGIESTSPAGGTYGVQATTGQDVAALLQILTGQITFSQLFIDLGTPIQTLQSQLDDNASDALAAMLSVYDEQQSRALAILNEARDRGTSITDVRRVVNEGDAQLAQSITTLTAVVNGNVAAIQTEATTRANADAAEAVLRSALAAQVNDPSTGLPATRATLLTDYSTTTTVNAAIASSATTVTAAYIAADASTLASANAFTYSRATIDSAIATSTNTVTARLNNFGGTGATIETNYTAQASSITGLNAQYTVKMDVGGNLSGFGLQSDLIAGGTATSRFIVSVDQFAVATPGTSVPLWVASQAVALNAIRRISGVDDKVLVCKKEGTTGSSAPSIAGAIGSTVTDNGVVWQIGSRVPFAVLTVPTTINGTLVPAGSYFDAAYTLNGTIQTAQIGLLAVDDARSADLAVAKLRAGNLRVGGFIRSTAYSAGVSGWTINADGSVEFNNGTFRGALGAATGTFAGSLSAATGTFTGSLTAATGTFSGSLSAATGTFTGTLTVGSSPAVSGTTMTGTGGVINASGTFALGNSTTNINFNGTTLTLNGAVVTAANLNLGALSVSISPTSVSSTATTAASTAHGTLTATGTGGTGPYTYAWSVSSQFVDPSGSTGTAYVTGTSGTGGQTCGVGTINQSDNCTIVSQFTVVVTDANGRTASASASVNVRRGTAP